MQLYSRLITHWTQYDGQYSSLAQERIKSWTEPTALPTVSGLTHSRSDLIAENALLCQQLIILKGQVNRPQFTHPWRSTL